MKLKVLGLLAVIIIALLFAFKSCSEPDIAALKVDPSKPKTVPGQPAPKKAGGMMETEDHPAPPGVKTGLEGGKKD